MPDLTTLPAPLLSRLVEHPKAAAHVACTCRALRQTIQTLCDGLWEAQCINLGWSAPVSANGREGVVWHYEKPLPQQRLQPPQDASGAWYRYFCHRISLRKRIRRLCDLYTAFLPPPCRMAFNPGATLAQLGAVQSSLGLTLPWELCELLRHRNGQAPATHVWWADDTRLLGASELHVVAVDTLAATHVRRQVLEESTAALQCLGLPQVVLAQMQQQPLDQHQPSSALRCVVFAENAGRTRSHLIDIESGAVIIMRGFSAALVAPSLIRFLQKLLT